MNRSKTLLLCSLFFITGIGTANIITFPLFEAYFLLIVFIVALFLNKKNLLLRYLIIFSICFLVGTLRCELAEPKTTKINQQEEITLQGIIIKEPENRGNNCELIVENNLTKEKILLRTDLYPEYYYGDKIEIKCKPKFIEQNTSYGRYLAKNKIEFICYYPGITLLSKNNGNKIYATILNFKQKSRDIIEKTLPDPEAKVLSAIILGYKKQIPNDLREKFAQVGISHIVAISGMHLVIISFILLSVLISLGMWRQKAFYITLILLWLFIIIVGMPSSATRAGIMISVVMFAQHLGRVNNLISVLSFTAALLLVFNPLLLFGDVGFQLSFLAILGIVYLSPIIYNWFKKIPDFWELKKILIITLAAQAATLPIAVYHFGNIPFLSLPVNLIAVPLLPIILSLGLILIFSGFVSIKLAGIIGWIVWAILNMLLKIVNLFVSLPFSHFYIEKINFLIILAIYILIIIYVYYWKKNNKFETFFQ